MEDGPFLLGPKEMEQAENSALNLHSLILLYTKRHFKGIPFFVLHFAKASFVSCQIQSFALFICDDTFTKIFCLLFVSFLFPVKVMR